MLVATNTVDPVLLLSMLAVNNEYVFLQTRSKEQATSKETQYDCTASAYPFINISAFTHTTKFEAMVSEELQIREKVVT